MLSALLLASLSWAGEPAIVEAGATATPVERSVLLPEADFRDCWASRRNLPLCKEALEVCELRSTEALDHSAAMLEKTTTVFDLALDRFTEDERLVNDCALKALEQERTITDLSVKLQTARSQRNSAYAVTGAVVLGAAFGLALSL